MNPNDPYNQLPPSPQPQPSQSPYSQAPAQPGVPATPASTNPYDFILNPPAAPKRSLFNRGATRLLAIVGVISLVVIVGGLLVVALAPSSGSKQTLTSLAQEQQEIIRIAQAGERLATDQSTRNLAYNVDLSVSTNQTQLLNYMNSKRIKVDEKQLSAKQDSSTDTLLESAQSTSTYDSALKKVLATQLTTYLSDLQQAYKTSTNSTLKQILSNSFAAGKTLLTEAQQP